MSTQHFAQAPVISITTSDDEEEALIRNLFNLSMYELVIGVTDETAERPGESITNADLVYIHEFGAPEANIPARPFMVPAVEASFPKMLKALRKAAHAAMSLNKGSTRSQSVQKKALQAAGEIAANAIKTKMEEGPFASLAKATLRARRRRGNYDTRPLLDTKQLQDSITYEVRKTEKSDNLSAPLPKPSPSSGIEIIKETAQADPNEEDSSENEGSV